LFIIVIIIISDTTIILRVIVVDITDCPVHLDWTTCVLYDSCHSNIWMLQAHHEENESLQRQVAEMLQSNSAIRQELEVKKSEVGGAQQGLAEAVSSHSKALKVSWHVWVSQSVSQPFSQSVTSYSKVCSH